MNIIKENKSNNKIFKIAITMIILVLALIILGRTNMVFATATESASTNTNVMKTINILDSLIGVFPTLVISLIKIVLLFIMTSISWIVGFTISGKGMLTLDNILFNDLPLINLNYNPQKAGDYSLFVGAISSAVQLAMAIAVVVQLLVLLITIIKYMTKTLAKDKADTKIVLINWLKGVGIMFGVLLFMFFMIEINNTLVNAVRQGIKGGQPTIFKGVTNEILKNALTNQGFGGIASTFIYIAILAQTVFFYFYYLKRFVVVTLLMMVAPLVTATYSLDILDDKKSQTLQFWTNKFLHTVFIQVFHVFIYVALIFPLVTGNANTEWILRPTEIVNFIEMGVLTVFGMLFFFKAEGLLKKIFGLKGDGVQSSASATMLVVNKVTKSVNKAIKLKNTFKDTQTTNDKVNKSMDNLIRKENNEPSPKNTTSGQGKPLTQKEKEVLKKLEQFGAPNRSAEEERRERKAFNKMQKEKEREYRKKDLGKRRLKSFARGTVAATSGFATAAITAGLKNMDAIEMGGVAETASKRAAENYDAMAARMKAKKDGQIMPGIIKNNTRGGKEKIREQYEETVEKFATYNAQILSDIEKITGIQLTSETEEGRRNQQVYFELIKAREKEIEGEFENAKKELTKHIKKMVGDTNSLSDEVISRMQEELKEKKSVITRDMNEKVREFALKYKEKELLEMMKDFEEMTKRINDKIVSKREDTELGRYTDVIDALPNSEERLRRNEELVNANTLDPDNSKDLEDAMYFDTIIRDVLKDIGRM